MDNSVTGAVTLIIERSTGGAAAPGATSVGRIDLVNAHPTTPTTGALAECGSQAVWAGPASVMSRP